MHGVHLKTYTSLLQGNFSVYNNCVNWSVNCCFWDHVGSNFPNRGGGVLGGSPHDPSQPKQDTWKPNHVIIPTKVHQNALF